jgi:transcriptional regulator of acetoin/glycerol metabolism
MLEVPSEGGVVGSGEDCELILIDPTVSRRHARLTPAGGGLAVADLGSTNGTWVDGRRVREATVVPGESVLFGRVRLHLDRVAAGDRVVALTLPSEAEPKHQAPVSDAEEQPAAAWGEHTTLGLGPLDALAAEIFPRLLSLVRDGTSVPELARWMGAAVLQVLPVAELDVRHERGGILFRGQGRSAAHEPQEPQERVTQEGRFLVRAIFADPTQAHALAPLVDALALSLDLAEQLERPLPRVAAPPRPPPLPGAGSVDPTVLQLFRLAARVAPGDIGVLILGESGTGKELFARHLHVASGRASWVDLNCAALPRDLLESELFGVEKGTATGVEARPGKLELADEGTLFLDEIGDMAAETQAKILRVLQEGEVYRLGASRPRPARARVVAATNRDVQRLVTAGNFRLDLYHRIAGWVVELPPLRQRAADIPSLALGFLAEEGRKLGRRWRGISQAALDALVAYAWPGNIRQLQQEIGRCALFMDEGAVLEASLLAAEIQQGAGVGVDRRDRALADRLEAFERLEIERALAACGGQVAGAAALLGIHRATLYRRLKALGIAAPS